MSGPTDQEWRQGRRRLRDLLPAARAFRRNNPGEIETGNSLGAATLPHARLDNLDAMMVYPAPLGGWHADLVFKHVPPGLPNTIGSPVAKPYATRGQAEAGAMRLLAMVLQLEDERAHAEQKSPVFLLHGFAITLPAAVYAKTLAMMPEARDGYGTVEHAIERIKDALSSLLPQEVTADALNALPREKMASLMAVLLGATLTGFYAYPPRRDVSPSGHAEAEIS